MRLSEFDYELPPELIAQHPGERRDASRMLVLDRQKGGWSDSEFAAIPAHLKATDLLVVNNTRVFPARLIGRRDPTGGRVEVLLVRELGPLTWEAMARPGHRLNCGARIRFGDGELKAEVLAELDDGLRVLRFESNEPFDAVLERVGEVPLPPYIKRTSGSTEEDRERYQTVYASNKGAIAAPTAGLHFTESVLRQIREMGVQIVEITLHVGYGTFAPVRTENVEQHRVSPERFEISSKAAKEINEARSEGKRVVAVGTTTTRALESSLNAAGQIATGKGIAEVTITPGYTFRVAGALITNFHLPQSSLLLLVCAFAGRDLAMDAYRHAVAARYRFYSYGDCMLIQ
jgi:S-adenosylmethionine:tRNA ribosyltransferase-isomerase